MSQNDAFSLVKMYSIISVGRGSFWCSFDVNPSTFHEDITHARKTIVFAFSFPVTLTFDL